MRFLPLAAAAALVALSLCGCGGGSHESLPPAASQTQPMTTSTTQQRPPQGSRSRQHPAHRARERAKATQLRPLARLAIACRSAPSIVAQPYAHGRAATRALATRVSTRVRLLRHALRSQPGLKQRPIVAPLLHTLGRVRKAVRQASRAPGRPGAAQRLQRAAAGLSAAVERIGVPECALAGG
jgi:predicted small lipoprotein YifL